MKHSLGEIICLDEILHNVTEVYVDLNYKEIVHKHKNTFLLILTPLHYRCLQASTIEDPQKEINTICNKNNLTFFNLTLT